MGSLQPRSQGPEGAVVWGRGQSIPLLFTPAVHQVEAGGFAANPGGDLASGREDQDAAITFGDAPVPDHPSPKHRSAWAVSQGLGTAAGDTKLAEDLSGACAALPCSSLRAEASISWPSPERQTGDKQGWDKGPCPHPTHSLGIHH